MMGYDGWGFFGMHALGWLFLDRRDRRRGGRETPLEVKSQTAIAVRARS